MRKGKNEMQPRGIKIFQEVPAIANSLTTYKMCLNNVAWTWVPTIQLSYLI